MEAKWYVVRTFSGHENKVKQFLETGILENEQLKLKIKEILVPTEKVFEVKDGKKRSKTKNFFPGYILVQAELDNQVKEFILRTQSVMGFLGTGNMPNPLQPEEVRRIVGRITQNESTERMETIFWNGDLVKIIDGPFNSFVGTIKEIELAKQKTKVCVSIFGRETLIDLNFSQVVKEE